MSYATVYAYHVYQATMSVMRRMTESMNDRNQRIAELHPRWWEWSKMLERRELQSSVTVDWGKGQALGRLLRLSIAATSVSPMATLALDEYDLELIGDPFFDPALMQSVRSQMAFAAAPGGNA